MALTTVIVVGLTFLLFVALGFTYLAYVRMRELQKELETMRSRIELHDGELEQIESSLSDVDIEP